MAVPQLGYLALSENPTDEAGRALVRQFVLAREADRMGYDDIWLGEHHGDALWPQAGVLSLLGHLSAVTSKARFACSADTSEEAEGVAQPYLQQQAARTLGGDAAALRALALVGEHAAVARQFKALADTYGATHVAIVPTSGQFDTHKHILAAFVDEVRPLLDED